MEKKKLIDFINLVIWGNGNADVDQGVFNEMKLHAIAALPTNYLSILNISSKVKQEWKSYIIQQMSFNTRCQYEQSVLPISVPYAILKGTSAAMYYPHPEFRTLGDIDIITRREDFDTACRQLMDNGYCIIKELNREVSLIKNGIIVELHRRFATLNDPIAAEYLDNLIIDNIMPSHILPDHINGLVLLEHIDQHLEGGLGLRQIIDWMMFVDKCLPDKKWQDFSILVKKIGLEKFAVACTRMCEIYLGLPEREWCASADPIVCDQLMEYVLSCGNFGNKKMTDDEISKNVFAYAKTPRMFFKLLQKQGLTNWEAAKKYKVLRPFAWIYQAFRYAIKGINRKGAVFKLKNEYIAAKKRNQMLEQLGVKTAAKGVVVLKDGKYVIE